MSFRKFARPRAAVAVLALTIAALPALAAAATDPAYDSGGTGNAARLLERSSRSAYHGRYTEAIDLDNKALALSPNFGQAFESRAGHYMDTGRFAEATADLDRVLIMHPTDMGLTIVRVRLRLLQGDGKGALAALKTALTLPLYSYRHNPSQGGLGETESGDHWFVTGHMESRADEYSSIAHQLMHNDDASLIFMQNMIKLEVQHPEYVLANYCYVAGVAGLLDSAELACQQSIEENSHDIGQYDSLGYVHVRMKQWDKAIADYNKAIDDRPDLTLSLYGRGIAKRAKGDIAGGNADIAAATRDEPDIANIMKRLGVPAI